MIKDINEKRFSYSSLTTFETCKHGFYLTYIDTTDERENNFFAEYGLLVHEGFELFFKGELEAFELADFYDDNYDKFVVHSPPFFVKEHVYKKQGHDFFENFDFVKDNYEVLVVEDVYDVDLLSYNLVIKPDLVIKEKSTGKVILLDYKSSLIYKNGKLDKKKVEGYRKQMTMYATYLKTVNIVVDEVWIWFVRQPDEPFYRFEISNEEESGVVEWIDTTIKDIKSEVEFEPTIQKFFCQNLCSVSSRCEYFNQ